jgi:ABC-type dipeptide/oligopeptide/nickel transport system ATPase component
VIVEEGLPAQIFTAPQHRRTRDFLQALQRPPPALEPGDGTETGTAPAVQG